jgi:hypothetical protein
VVETRDEWRKFGAAEARSASNSGMRACHETGEVGVGVAREPEENLSFGLGKWRARGSRGGMMGTSGGGGGEMHAGGL